MNKIVIENCYTIKVARNFLDIGCIKIREQFVDWIKFTFSMGQNLKMFCDCEIFDFPDIKKFMILMNLNFFFFSLIYEIIIVKLQKRF